MFSVQHNDGVRVWIRDLTIYGSPFYHAEFVLAELGSCGESGRVAPNQYYLLREKGRCYP